VAAPALDDGPGYADGLISPEPFQEEEQEQHTPHELRTPSPGVESPPLPGVFVAEPESKSQAQPARGSSWTEVQQCELEDLQRELEVEMRRPCASIETQTECNFEDVVEDVADRWFAGFVDPTAARPGAAQRPRGSEGAGDEHSEEASSSSSSSSDSEEEEAAGTIRPAAGTSTATSQAAGTIRPERQLRRRPAGSRSRSRGEGRSRGRGGPATGGKGGARGQRKGRSVSSSSSSTSTTEGSSAKRQREPSSEKEPGALASGPVVGGPPARPGGPAGAAALPDLTMDPRMRMRLQDYSDVA